MSQAAEDKFVDPVDLARAMVEHLKECGSAFEKFVDDSSVFRRDVAFLCTKTQRRFSIGLMDLRRCDAEQCVAMMRMWMTPEDRAAFAANPRSEL